MLDRLFKIKPLIHLDRTLQEARKKWWFDLSNRMLTAPRWRLAIYIYRLQSLALIMMEWADKKPEDFDLERFKYGTESAKKLLAETETYDKPWWWW
jgi:hypothetical protein